MSAFDLIIRGGHVVTAERVGRLDIGITGGRIAALAPEISGAARVTIEAGGLHVFPGVIDAHVHFNEPGRAHWEGLETGSKAVAAGGGTMFFDMPLNAHPPTIDAESFRLKRTAAERASFVDFSLWGALTPLNLDQMEELAGCGVIGFKAFMCDSGIQDFASSDERSLREGMRRAAALNLPVAVHAESEILIERLWLTALKQGGSTVRDYLDSRPIQAELEAIGLAIDLAATTGCRLHVVHVSSAAGVGLISAARGRGVDVTCETCPHYLALTDEDAVLLGPSAKCAPPLRSALEQKALWQELLEGRICTVGSDHSPSPPTLKQSPNFFRVWGGISGAQHLLPLTLTLAHFDRGAALPLLARLLSANVAQRFSLPPHKGTIAVGCDANLALVKLGDTHEIRAADLFYRHRQSPYLGRRLRAQVQQTLLRGQTVFKEGRVVGKPSGRLVRPVPHEKQNT